MSKTKIRFGTDGWRAIIADDYTFENVRACAEGVARHIEEAGLAQRGLVIGYDTRFGSADFAAAAAEVLAGHTIKVYLFDRPAATPVACHSILDRETAGAIIITASHNPGSYSGFKFKPEYAGSAPPEVVDSLESHIEAGQLDGEPRRIALPEAMNQGLVESFDPRPAYLNSIRQIIDLDAIKKAGISIVFDAMHATGAGIISSLLEGGASRVAELKSEPNPAFPGMVSPEPIGRNLAGLTETVLNSGADVGLATDGDADRLGIVDEQGHFVDQLQTFALLCYYLLEYRGQRGPLVRSLTSTRMIDRLGELYDVPVYETKVGFKYLGPKMIETNAIAAGEESGGYSFHDHLPERDGCFAGLLFLDLLAHSDRSPSQLVQELYAKVGHHYYDRSDEHLAPEQRSEAIAKVAAATPVSLAGLPVLSQDTLDGYRYEIESGWLLLRPSGTEPILRIYCETTDKSLVKPLLQEGREIAGL